MSEPDATNSELEGVDASWWTRVYESAGEDSTFEPPEHLWTEFLTAAQQACEVSGVDSLHARVLTVLSRAVSPMLQPQDWNEPFRPSWETPDGRRGPLPQDMGPDELALLALIAPLLTPAPLRARVADIAWTYGGRRDRALLTVALDAYLDVPVNADTWHRSGADGYRRAREIAGRRGKDGAGVRARLAEVLRTFVLGSGPSDRWAVVGAAELLRQTARPLAESATPDTGRALLRQVIEWQRGHDPAAVLHAQEAIAELYVLEAEDRLARDKSAMVASMFLEKAIATLRTLPHKHRNAHGIQPWLRELRRELVDLREETLEEMHGISVPGPDLTEYVREAERAVAGLGRFDALVRLASIAPLIDLSAALDDERERSLGLISRLFDATTFSGDGRKVARQEGITDGVVTDRQAFDAVVKHFSLRSQLHTQCLIHPALRIIVLEHRYDLPFLRQICEESPLVPVGHEWLWARGLLHGLSGDFPSAVSVLVPQVEQLIRRSLKIDGIDTLYVADDGTEKEKALGSLLEMPETVSTLGPNWTFELRALLSEQLGPNLRNDLAHGLLTDGGSWSTSSLYAWWHCLRLVILPYDHLRRAHEAEQAEPASSVD
jgi:hypothetical protein